MLDWEYNVGVTLFQRLFIALINFENWEQDIN